HRLVVTAKGLERGSNALLTSVIEEEAPGQPTAILSGPSFAHDVGAGLPTAVTLAAATLDDAKDLANGLKSNSFRPYASDDLVGVQLGGALKNVLAIAAGAVDGKGLGESAKAALITRGFTELGRLATALGARRETLSGLSGLGDLVLPCSTAGSRNYRFGLDLGRGVPVPKLLGAGQPLAEGAKTAAAALALGRTHGVELPITSVVAQIVAGELSVDEAIEALMARPLRHE
ncbi:MAG: NAD(P)H-dependent glycerol-3-phosphate dehydrogenase, partial [Devosiaceae bacterium]|nr:NAD(P)H-dependent glycerol-3-phosphate dehydrogenase [Devosiaceae bacterium MH13]